jgi:hypothetical protein
VTARELGRITLAESLALTALVVQKDPGRRSRYTLRRLLEEDENLTIQDASLAASALAALGGPRARGGVRDPLGHGRTCG